MCHPCPPSPGGEAGQGVGEGVGGWGSFGTEKVKSCVTTEKKKTRKNEK